MRGHLLLSAFLLSAPLSACEGTRAPYGHVLYLDFSGGAFHHQPRNDAARNATSLGRHQRTTVVPPFFPPLGSHAGETSREAWRDQVASRVSAAFADFDVQVVTSRPPVEAFTLVALGGTVEDVDVAPAAPGYAGVTATAACDAPSDRDVSFVLADDVAEAFLEREGSLVDTLAHVAVHEAAHAFGLVHNNPRDDSFMGLAGPSLSWGKGPVIDPRSCGRAEQDDRLVLAQTVGLRREQEEVPTRPDVDPPLLLPSVAVQGATLAPGFTPCFSASDASGITYALAQAYRREGDDYVLAAQGWTEKAPYRFAPLTAPGSYLLRLVANDAWDNVAIRELEVSIAAGGAPGPRCL